MDCRNRPEASTVGANQDYDILLRHGEGSKLEGVKIKPPPIHQNRIIILKSGCLLHLAANHLYPATVVVKHQIRLLRRQRIDYQYTNLAEP